MSQQRRQVAHLIRPQMDYGSLDRDLDDSDAEVAEEQNGDGREHAEAADGHAGDEVVQDQPEPVKVVRNPAMPTAVERALHEITHWPFRDWCPVCVKSRGLGQAHRSIKPEDAESDVPRVAMDYGFIKEDQTITEDEHGTGITARVCMTILVMVETMCNSVWAYAIEGKGAASTDWLAPKMVDDMNTIGMARERIIAKSDQEASIVQLQQEVAKLRKDAGTAIENSRVGDSNSNGAVERAIREVKGMTRTLRCHLEEKLGKKVKLDDPVVPWMIRHAAYIVTRCRLGPDGKTAMQKLKGRRVITPMLPFGEAVLFKLPKVPNMPGDFEDRFEVGIWLGCLIRTGEHLVGTGKGVHTVSQIVRCTEDKKWSSELIEGIKGTPKEPVPGSGTHKVRAYAKQKEDEEIKAPRFEPRKADELPEVRVFHIYKRDVEEHGATPGCAGCRAITNPGNKYRARHTPECRARFEGLLQQTEEGARRIGRASEREERLNQEIAARGEVIMEEKRQGETAEPNQASGEASGSRLSEEERRAGVAAQREAEGVDETMEGEFGPHGHKAPMSPSRIPVPEDPDASDEAVAMESEGGAELAAAPAGARDIRVPLEERNPAVKHGRDETSPDKPRKWQAYETNAKRERGDDNEEPGAKWQTVESGVENIEESEESGIRQWNRPVVRSEVESPQEHLESPQEPRTCRRSLRGIHLCRSSVEPLSTLFKDVPWGGITPSKDDGEKTWNDENVIDENLDAFADENTLNEDEDVVDVAFQEFLSKFSGPKPGDGDISSAELEPKLANHPGPKVKRHEVEKRELMWQDIGSGTFARTFLGAKRLITTTRGGPPMCDVHRRTIWSLRTGKVIDDCIVEDAPDHALHRELSEEEDIRVELVLKGALAMYERQGADVVELYSQPRIAQSATAKLYGGAKLTPGWSLDLTRLDPKTGKAWDLGDEKVQSRVVKMIAEGKPLFVIGSPPCTPFCSLQNLNAKKRDPRIVDAERRAGEKHIEFCLKIYGMQIKANRFFVHEHPNTATSWKMAGMVELLATEKVDQVVVDLCQFGLVAEVDGEERPVQKRTKIVSNSQEVLKRVDVKCPNLGGKGEPHEHATLLDGKAKRAQVYPRRFCQAVCEGIAAQKRLHALGMEARSLLTLEEMAAVVDNIEEHESPSEALHEEDLRIAFDDQSGEPLDPCKVRAARKEEIQYFKSMDVYEKVSLDECWKTTGNAPIRVKWVDINKGDSQNPNYRSRLVAMEFKKDERPEWYAATPPSECLKIILSLMAGDRKKKMLYADVSRAYFYARAARPVYVKLPDEDQGPGDDNMCGKLNVSMYGTRDAALNWALEYGETLKAAGYQQGVSNPCLFWHPQKEVTVMVHGDDFVAVGDDEELKETEKTLREKYKIKVEKLGNGKQDAKEVRVLNKVIRYTSEGLELEADPRHAEIVIRDLELDGRRSCKTPGVKLEGMKTVKKDDEPDGDDEEVEEEMSAKDATKFRAVVARLNYMAADRADIQYAVKEAARHMSSPRVVDWHALKRIGLYLKGRPRLVMRYRWQQGVSTAVTYTDSDWAGCRKTGKSTSGGVVTIGGHVIKTYSRQQKTVALSSAEAELHAMVAASAETIGVMNLCSDMGIKLRGEVYADSSAAMGIAQRAGCGKVRHLRVQALWVQEVRSTGRLAYHKVLGSRNPADILTKHVPAELLNAHVTTLGLELRGGRAETAPTLDALEAWTIAWVEEESAVEKHVTFSQTVRIREIPAVGKCRKTEEARRVKTRKVRGGEVPGGDDQKNGGTRRSWADITDEDDKCCGETSVVTTKA